MSYGVDGLGEATSVEDGTSLLVTGNSTHTDRRLFDALTPEAGERVIVITMNLGAERVVDELEERGADRDQIGVIDCTNHDDDVDGVAVRRLNSPGDLTGISLEFAKLLDGGDESVPVRVGFSSVSTALMYAELRTVFRFLHVFTARVRSGDMFGVFTMDPAMHEEQAHNTIRAVFDCEATVDEDGLELRGTGFE
ncbi:recombinase RecA [Natronomonas salina]|uniref:DUF7504 family protein n=1 Tax=Natronomonas salina TaxID=1710540 RepID=UPI0015B39968|nr:recombinase RecA [Natronomonas salina]QLD87520.1 recombinase RecA [Natronomonas salina]